MLTDLRLRKYLLGRLSRSEEKELEALMESNPDLKSRLEELRHNERVALRPAWERMILERNEKHGSRVRYTTILPALLMLVLILVLASHWFNKPGANSTFLLAGNTGSSVDILYGSKFGWRYFDAGFRPGDSLTFSVRDSGRYMVRIYGVYDGLPDPVVEEIWASSEGVRYSKHDAKPVFGFVPTSVPKSAPKYLAVVYDTATFHPPAEELLDLWTNDQSPRAPSYRYQVLRVPESAL